MTARLRDSTRFVLPAATTLLSAGVLSIAVELWQNSREEAEAQRLEQEARYIEGYEMLNAEYLRFLELCLEHIDVNAASTQTDLPESALTPEQADRRRILYEYLFSIFERAYLARERSPRIAERIWPGWDHYVRDYLGRESFRTEVAGWKYADGTMGMDPRFEAYIAQTMTEVTAGR